jgi:hypothetical protein
MPPIPITPADAMKAVELVTKVVTEKQKAAKNVELGDAHYYSAWIELASEAIKGLEREYHEILIQADFCQP